MNKIIFKGMGIALAGLILMTTSNFAARKTKSSTSNNAIEITSEDQFNKEVLNDKGKVIVKLYANWCGACQASKAPFEELAGELKGVKCVTVNVDGKDTKNVVVKYQGNGIPHFILFENGKKTKEKTGFGGKEGLKSYFSL